MGCTISIAFKRHGRHRDDRELSELLLQCLVFRLALNQSQPPSIIMDDDVDMIRVLERRRAAIECRVIERPPGRSELPDELSKVVPVFLVAGAAAFRGTIK